MAFLTYIVRSQRMAGYLMQRGFKLHEIKRNRDYPEKNVFLFTNSIELQNVIKVYKRLVDIQYKKLAEETCFIQQ